MELFGYLADTFDNMVEETIEYSADMGENGGDPSLEKRSKDLTSSKPPTRVSTLLMPATSTAANSNPLTSPPQEPRTTTTTPQRTTQTGRQFPMDQQRGRSRGRGKHESGSSPFINGESRDKPVRSPSEDPSSTSGPPEPQEPLGKSVFEEEISRPVVSSQLSRTVNRENFQNIPQTQESEDNDNGHYDDYGTYNLGNADPLVEWGNVTISERHS